MEVTIMKKVISIAIALIILNVPSAVAQTSGTAMSPLYVPRDSSAIMWSAGIGFGVPYGVLGGKFSLGTDMITADLGFGILPLAWEPAISLSGVVHSLDRYNAVRPKITFTYSNIVAANILMKEGTLDPMYEETFSGVAAYAGIDWRLGKTSPWCVDLNIGWIFPFVGNDEIKKRWDRQVAYFRSIGYQLTSETISLDTPKIYIGITYSIGRSLAVNYNR